MPWHIDVRDGRYCVIKDADGSTEKCHTTRAAALAHMAALYANVEKLAEAAHAAIVWIEAHGETQVERGNWPVQHLYALLKADGTQEKIMSDDMTRESTFAKVDPARQNVFGWANVAFTADGEQVVDLQDNVIDMDDLERAAYGFVVEYRLSGEMHQGFATGTLIESMIVTPEKLKALGLAEDALPVGWWVGFHFDDPEVFGKVRDGTYKMFSIQGRAVMKDVE